MAEGQAGALSKKATLPKSAHDFAHHQVYRIDYSNENAQTIRRDIVNLKDIISTLQNALSLLHGAELFHHEVAYETHYNRIEGFRKSGTIMRLKRSIEYSLDASGERMSIKGQLQTAMVRQERVAPVEYNGEVVRLSTEMMADLYVRLWSKQDKLVRMLNDWDALVARRKRRAEAQPVDEVEILSPDSSNSSYRPKHTGKTPTSKSPPKMEVQLETGAESAPSSPSYHWSDWISPPAPTLMLSSDAIRDLLRRGQ